jgi:radical SAM protein with 4Fe4S-binding SPASM domain
MAPPERSRAEGGLASDGPPRAFAPRVCVWEVTLACNARCRHCGSSAGEARPRELTTAEGLALVDELRALGGESLTLSGGEPLLRPDWPELAAAARSAGLEVEIISNGLLVQDRADAIAGAGFSSVTLSVDGPPAVHDALRGVPAALERLFAGARALATRGVQLGAVTQVNRLNLQHLEALHDLLVENGFAGWQAQLTMPLGRAAPRRSDLCLAPADLPDLEARLLELQGRTPLFLQIADNVGYLGRAEAQLRSGTGSAHRFWTGCGAGLEVVGVTSDGTVRGCLALPPAFDEGNLRERSLEAIWKDGAAFAYNRSFDPRALEGDCASCPLGRVCRGGCRSLAFSATGSAFSNPYCLRHLVEAEPAR